MEDVLLQQAFGGASFQHVRDDDGGLATLKVRVVPASRDGDPEAEPWRLHGQTTQITERRRKITTCSHQAELFGLGSARARSH